MHQNIIFKILFASGVKHLLRKGYFFFHPLCVDAYLKYKTRANDISEIKELLLPLCGYYYYYGCSVHLSCVDDDEMGKSESVFFFKNAHNKRIERRRKERYGDDSLK